MATLDYKYLHMVDNTPTGFDEWVCGEQPDYMIDPSDMRESIMNLYVSRPGRAYLSAWLWNEATTGEKLQARYILGKARYNALVKKRSPGE